jgi:hypothetical protein
MNRTSYIPTRVALLTVVLATAFGFGVGMSVCAVSGSHPAPTVVVNNPFDQSNFPCTEDEVLGYDETFGPDKVGCIHIDNL